MKNFGKYLLLIFAFLSIGGGSGYANTLPEIRKEQPSTSEDLKAASFGFWVYRENPFQKLSDPAENLFFKSISVIPDDLSNTENPAAGNSKLDYERDLRQILSQQIFPTHFFL